MSYEQTLKTITMEAGADLSAGQYHCVVLASDDGQVDLAASAGIDVLGILQDKPTAAGIACNVAYGGVSKVVCSGTINPGANVATYSDGTVRAASATQIAIGVHVGKVASTSGDVIPVLLNGAHAHNALS